MFRTSFVQFAIFISILVAAGCGGSPTEPSGGQNFQGVWQGSWQRTSCTETGGAIGSACSQTPSSGSLRLTLTQTGNNVQGNVEFGSLIIASSGSVNGSGSLSLAGQARLSQGSAPGTFTLSNWSTSRSGNSMNGNFTLTFVADNTAFGSQIVQVALQNVTTSS